MRGYHLWFTIEIISFYGYILSACLFIFESQILSSLGWLNKNAIQDQYEHDFLNYHNRDLDWFALVVILSMVNIIIMFLNTIPQI